MSSVLILSFVVKFNNFCFQLIPSLLNHLRSAIDLNLVNLLFYFLILDLPLFYVSLYTDFLLAVIFFLNSRAVFVFATLAVMFNLASGPGSISGYCSFPFCLFFFSFLFFSCYRFFSYHSFLYVIVLLFLFLLRMYLI